MSREKKYPILNDRLNEEISKFLKERKARTGEKFGKKNLYEKAGHNYQSTTWAIKEGRLTNTMLNDICKEIDCDKNYILSADVKENRGYYGNRPKVFKSPEDFKAAWRAIEKRPAKLELKEYHSQTAESDSLSGMSLIYADSEYSVVDLIVQIVKQGGYKFIKEALDQCEKTMPAKMILEEEMTVRDFNISGASNAIEIDIYPADRASHGWTVDYSSPLFSGRMYKIPNEIKDLTVVLTGRDPENGRPFLIVPRAL